MVDIIPRKKVENSMKKEFASRIKDIESLNIISSGYRSSIILLTAVKEKVFTYLDDKAKSASEISKKLRTNPRATEILLNALTGMGFLKKKSGKYSNAKISSEYLVEGKPYYQGNILEHNWNIMQRWIKLDEVLKTGKPATDKSRRTKKETEAFILGMQNIAKQSAKQLLEKVDISDCRNMFDLGGGPATYSIAFTKANPQLKAKVIDFKDVLVIARKQIKKNKAERVSTQIGDIQDGSYGKDADLILISNIIHSMGPDEIQNVFRNCAEASVKGGMLIVKDFFPKDDRSGPEFATSFAINMLVGTDNGNTYTVKEVKSWMRSAGFGRITKRSLAANSSILVGYKAE